MPGIYWRNLSVLDLIEKLIGAWGIENHTCFPCLSPKQVIGVTAFPFECYTRTSFLRARVVMEVSIWACGAGLQDTPVCSQGESSEILPLLCHHCSRLIRMKKELLLGKILIYVFSWAQTMAQGLLFHPIAFPLGRMFDHRHMGSSCMCSGEWWNWRWGRIQARSRFPSPLDHHPQESKCFQTTSANAPFWEVSQQFVTFLHLPSLLCVPSSVRTNLTDSRALEIEMKNPSRDCVFLQFLSENEGKRGEERRRAWLLMCSLVS